jgi:hypothetical protein
LTRSTPASRAFTSLRIPPSSTGFDQAAIAQWKLVRAGAFEARCYADEPSAKAQAAILGRMTQIQCRLERTYFKAYKELERIKAAR